jgi:hypothetical protein
MGASPASGGGPGFPLVSFPPAAKKDTASIPCAFLAAGRLDNKTRGSAEKDVGETYRRAQRSNPFTGAQGTESKKI